MKQIEGSAQYVDELADTVKNTQSYFIHDSLCNITSVHDFQSISNQYWSLTYKPYRNKLDLRIKRFLEESAKSNSLLFVRLNATFDQTVELQSVLKKFTNSDFKVLIINPIANLQLVNEVDWDLDHVSIVEIPSTNNKDAWDHILNGINLLP